MVDFDCMWSTWGEWTSCSRTCGNGTRERTRAVELQKLGNGVCPGHKKEMINCSAVPCKKMIIHLINQYK